MNIKWPMGILQMDPATPLLVKLPNQREFTLKKMLLKSSALVLVTELNWFTNGTFSFSRRLLFTSSANTGTILSSQSLTLLLNSVS